MVDGCERDGGLWIMCVMEMGGVGMEEVLMLCRKDDISDHGTKSSQYFLHLMFTLFGTWMYVCLHHCRRCGRSGGGHFAGILLAAWV